MKRVALCSFAATVVAGISFSASALQFYKVGSDQDPMVRSSDYLVENSRYFSASAELLQIQLEQGDKPLPWEFTRKLADASLGFGMQQRAAAIYKQHVTQDKDADSLAKARLSLSSFLYDYGFYSEADKALQALRERLPQHEVTEWQDIYSRNLMAQGQYTDAEEVLTKLDNIKAQDPLTRYNLAVAMINAGKVNEGITELDRVSELSVSDEEGLALRDKANLSLGYYFLRHKQGGSAIPVFNRVRTEGPYSNRALLGLGWAYLAPTGERQKRAAVGDEEQAISSFSTIGAILRPGFLDVDIYKRAGLRPFHLDRVDPTEEADLKRALVPWIELVNRDPMDPAVQEGLLAIPFALDRLGAHIQARDYYEKAVKALEQTRANLDQAMMSIRTNKLFNSIVQVGSDSETGYQWKLKKLPKLPEMFYLHNLLAEHPFQSAMKDYRDVDILIRDTETQRARISELQKAYAARTQQSMPEAKLNQHVAKVAQSFEPYKLDSVPSMQLEDRLATQTDAPPPKDDTAPPPVALQINETPSKFQGAYENLDELKARLDILEPKLKAAKSAGANLLQKIALTDLESQKKLNEKYLIEARFSLARIYDRQLHGDAP